MRPAALHLVERDTRTEVAIARIVAPTQPRPLLRRHLKLHLGGSTVNAASTAIDGPGADHLGQDRTRQEMAIIM